MTAVRTFVDHGKPGGDMTVVVKIKVHPNGRVEILYWKVVDWTVVKSQHR